MSLVSILITTFKREKLLFWGLDSIAKQDNPYKTEVIVLNDGVEDESENICKQFEDRLDINYIFTASNKESLDKWRVPGFALNIGAKKAKGDYLFISCAEMFHFNDCIKLMTEELIMKPKILAIPNGRDDLDSNFLTRVMQTDGNPNISDFNRCGALNVLIPFLMGCSKENYFEIGGYDEDFIGVGFEDNDFVERMISSGCKYFNTEAVAVHLYHPRVHGHNNNTIRQGMILNQNLLVSRRGTIKRNIGKEWGVL